MKSLPKICQGFLMSATLSPELNSLKNVVLHSPAILKLEEEKEDPVNKKGQLSQFYLSLPKKDKNLVIYVFLKLGLLKGKGLFFCNSTDAGYRLKLFLEQFSIRSAVLNSELPLRSRLNIIEQFNVGNFDYLIATDESSDTGASTKKSDDDEEQEDGQSKRKRRKDTEYGVARGLDFRHVSFVVNVDFPTSPQSYTHRVGRTARGGAKGVALSLVERESTEQAHLLAQVQEEQPSIACPVVNDVLQASKQDNAPATNKQAQPCPLDFDLSEIEGFRYRVEDVSRAVTRVAVRETRAAELRAEILNSERLQNHFAENPTDLQLLQHDRVASGTRVLEHLKHVPKYMLPRGMQVADLNKRRKRKRVKGHDGARRTDNDPLQSYTGEKGNSEGAVNGDEGDGFEEFFEDGADVAAPKAVKAEPKVFNNTRDGAGKSTAGRNAWKEKHNRGKFSNKKRKSDPKRRTSGI
jgi:ATP-dependent RNA helicase DDX56/DBP9